MLQHANSNNVSYYSIVNNVTFVGSPRFKITHTVLLACIAAIMLSFAIHAVPTRHNVDIGGYDSAYLQGFFDQQPAPAAFGVDLKTRWSASSAAFRLPLIGMPATVTLRVAAPISKTLILQSPTAQLTTSFAVAYRWHDLRFTESGSLTKWTDTAVSLSSTTAPWQKGDLREVGVLVDTLTYETGWFALPYPSTVSLSVVLAGMIAYLLHLWWGVGNTRTIGIAATFPSLLVALAWRWPMASFMVWRDALPWFCIIGLLLLCWHHRAIVQEHWQKEQGRYGTIGILCWGVWLWWVQQRHVTLVVPGVEKDFRSFASRTESLSSVLHADPFYQIGYPFILWAGQQLSSAAVFTVATDWAVIAAVITLCASWYIARRVLGRGWDLVCVAIMAASSFFVEYSLLIGSDMTFTACAAVSLAATQWAMESPNQRRRWFLVGVTAGLAYMVRHTGVILLAPVVLACFAPQSTWRFRLSTLMVVVAGWVVCAAPQLFVNIRDTGQIFFNFQAKNSWLAVYGNVDWGRWADVPDSISLRDVILSDPNRFFWSWWHSLVGVFGTGASTKEHDTALWQRLLSVPFNWLSTVGVLWTGWMVLERRLDRARAVLLVWAIGFVAISSIAFILPRMLLPLTLVAAMTATDGLRVVTKRIPRVKWIVIASILIAGLFNAGFTGATQLVAGQPDDEYAALSYVHTLEPQRLVVLIPAESPAGKYSALSDQVVARITQYPVDPKRVCKGSPDYVLWSNELVPPDSTLVPLAQFGRYWVFRMADSPLYCTPQ